MYVQKIIPSKFKIILKGGNEIEKQNTANVESQYLQIAQTQSLFN